MRSHCFGIVSILLGLSGICPILQVASLPDLVVRVKSTALSQSQSLEVSATEDGDSIEFFAKRAQFGSREHYFKGTLVRSPDYDPFLCEQFIVNLEMSKDGNPSLATLPPYKKPDENNPTVMLVPRGECTFEKKAYAAKAFYGAKAIMIYDRLASRYQWDEATNRVVFPKTQRDYECGNGISYMYDLPLDPPPYNAIQFDPIMGMNTSTTTEAMRDITITNGITNGNISSYELSTEGSDVGLATKCDLTHTALNPCESQLCLVTSHLENSSIYPVCCAWDLPITMPSAPDASGMDTSDILSVWLTIRQSELILQSQLLSFGSEVTIETRGSTSAFNATYVLMWIWGTLVTMVGGWFAARDYKTFGAKLKALNASEENQEEERGEVESDLESSFQDEIVFQFGNNDKNDQAKKKTSGKKEKNQEVWSLHSLPPPERKKKKRPSLDKVVQNAPATAGTDQSRPRASAVPSREPETVESFEMTHWHVLLFLVMASLTLLLLFFWKVYTLFFVLYGIGCAGAICKLIFNPLFGALIPKLGDEWDEEFKKPVMCGVDGFRTTSFMFSYGWAAIWMWYGISHYNPQHNPFFWISLNVFGATTCIYSACVLKLNSIKIATILLVAIFFYDIFFVFITPFLTGGVSVMLNVATGSNDLNAEIFCYKYPDERSCKGIGFLPMLFMLPQVNDYANRSVILGLGDIVLPGFLIAFCARYDEAGRLVGANLRESSLTGLEIPTKWYNGYFFPMMIAYSAGLFFAFLAVLVSGQGQPALLYICPICLVTILVLGRKNLKDIWNGAKVFRVADRFVKKTERDWGKARMQQFAEQCMEGNSARVAASRSENHSEQSPTSNKKSVKSDSEDPATPPDLVQHESKDVCFGNEDHPGTKDFRKAVEEVAADLGEEKFKQEIYTIIRRKLKGRRYFKTDGSIWEEATKKEITKGFRMAYNHARRKSSAGVQGFDPSELPTL
mmetsp:Transcript_6520/g.13851  ORF Transcript_6520/g.13851 Transcript_6520/m.13851 type:complete len:962 (-) Transcript_6520:462-3347(-)